MSEIKTACRGTSRLIEAATMTYEEYFNLHTQGAEELRAAYEALIGKYHELKARSEIDSRTVEAQAKRIDNIKPFLLDCASSDFVCTSQTLRDKANELLDMLNGE